MATGKYYLELTDPKPQGIRQAREKILVIRLADVVAARRSTKPINQHTAQVAGQSVS